MSGYDFPGPGDPETWPSETNHPLDPRNDYEEEEEINEEEEDQ